MRTLEKFCTLFVTAAASAVIPAGACVADDYGGASAAGGGRGILSLNDALDLARKNSPQIRAQQYAIEYAEARLDEATYYWTPKFELKSQFGPMPKEKDITASENDVWSNFWDDWGFTEKTSLSFWFPLFTSTKVYHTRELARVGLEVEELKAGNEILNVEYDVSRAFVGLQFAIAAEDVAAEAESYIDRIESEYRKLMASGQSSVRKTDQYRIDLARSKVLRVKEEIAAKRAYAERALCVHTGLKPPVRVETMDFANVSAHLRPEPEVESIANENRGDMKLIRSAIKAAQLKSDIEMLNWLPELLLVGEFYHKFSNAVPEYTSDNFYIKDGYNGRGVGLGFMLRWNLDPVRQIFKQKQADAELARTLSQMSLAADGIGLEVSGQYRDTLASLNAVGISYKARRSAKRFLTQEMMDYEAGDGRVDSVISALTSFIEQRAAYRQALHDWRVSLVKLQKLTGAQTTADLLESN